MEQVRSNIAPTYIETKGSWHQRMGVSFCRQLVFKKLDTMTDACLEIHEQQRVHILGDKDNPLKAIVEIHDQQTYLAFVKEGSIGAALAYIQGHWSSPDLVKVIRVFARMQNTLDDFENQTSWLTRLSNKWQHFRNNNSLKGSKNNILAHYDLGNTLYQNFLDEKMQYSAAIFDSDHQTLEQAQYLKLDTICQRLELKPSDHLVEIGSGWGGLAIFAAQHYGCKVTTTTISDAQHQYAKQKIAELNLESHITLLKKDYRLLEGQFDKLVSIEMIEAVGHKNFPAFFSKCNELLKPNGKLLIQAITIADQRYQYYCNNVDFIQRYIFPGGCLPSIAAISTNIANHTQMVIEQLHDIGLHYAQTISHWRERFDKSWPKLNQCGYDDNFKRLWHYYLCYCEGAFIEKATSTVHVVARK